MKKTNLLETIGNVLKEHATNDDKLLIIHTNDKKEEMGVIVCGTNANTALTCTIAALIESYYSGYNDDETVERMTEIIRNACALVMSKGGVRFHSDILKTMLSIDEENDTNDEDEDDDIEDCADCEFMRTCQQEDAIAYRKANGIPKPKKGKKGGKKNDNAN